jgi:multimeric flavodoxin WrbA
MHILGFLGSPRVKGSCSRLMQAVLDGAEKQGAKVKRYDLIKLNIQHCLGCCKCIFDDPKLPIGRCPIKDDMAAVLEDYIRADGYVLASPVYHGTVTALMKKFIERKFGLFRRDPKDIGKLVEARVLANFKKKAVMIATANSPDEFVEVMGDPCFEVMCSDWMIEQVETVGKLYVGSIDALSDADMKNRLETAFEMGKKLVNEIEKESNR